MMKTTITLQSRTLSQSASELQLFFLIKCSNESILISTPYCIKVNEWDESKECIIHPLIASARTRQLEQLNCRIQWDIQQLLLMIEETCTIEEKKEWLSQIEKNYQNICGKHSFFHYMEIVVKYYKRMGQTRTGETYQSTLNSFKRFRKNLDVSLEELDSELLQSYVSYLKDRGLSHNTMSFYLHRLRATYNRAIDDNLIAPDFPFKRINTSIEKTVKRAISIEAIRELKSMALDEPFSKAFSRDIFLFSFYTRGMSFVDIAFLKKKDIKNGMLTYRRKKTGQKLQIHWEPCMQKIVNKYPTSSDFPYLFPILTDRQKERTQYHTTLTRINRHLKELGRMIGLDIPLTMYVARHSWATTAYREGIPLSVISESMGHESEKTTQIYLASLESETLDNANRQIINLI